MRRDGRRSSNVEDRRGIRIRGGRLAAGGGGIILVVVLVSQMFGIDLRPLLSLLDVAAGGRTTVAEPGAVRSSPEEERLADFVRVVLADTEDTWHALFRQMGKRYQEPKLVLFRDRVSSACGHASASMGPFYCPSDHRIYIDLGFYDDLQRRFGAPGDFAQAYVIAHEVGHHIQNLLGISDRVHRARDRLSEAEYNDLSVRLELQADFLAGVWAHHAQKARSVLDPGDLEEALRCAAAIGDDRLQKQARGYARPESFTHGTSEQRMRWFKLGYETGDFNQGDTFRAKRL